MWGVDTLLICYEWMSTWHTFLFGSLSVMSTVVLGEPFDTVVFEKYLCVSAR